MIENLPKSWQHRISICNDTGCWLWTGKIQQDGYVRLKIKGRRFPAHRVIYELLVNKVPSHLQCDHLCRVRHCVNPLHIEPVEAIENVQRGISAKIDFATAEQIRLLYSTNRRMTQEKLASQFNLSRTAIAFITQGINWPRSKDTLATNVVKGRRKALSPEQVDEVQKMLDEGKTQRFIASVFDCSSATIFQIAHGRYAERSV